MSRSEAHWETDPQCWATATHQRQDGQSCTKTLLQPKIRDDKLRKCLSALRKKQGLGHGLWRGKKRAAWICEKRRKFSLKLWWQFLHPFSLLSQKVQTILVKCCWRKPGLLCPGSIMQTCFRHWYQVTAMQQLEAQRFGTWKHTGDFAWHQAWLCRTSTEPRANLPDHPKV